MLETYLDLMREQSRNVFGTHAKKTLSFYSVLSVAAVVLPLAVLVFFVAFRIF